MKAITEMEYFNELFADRITADTPDFRTKSVVLVESYLKDMINKRQFAMMLFDHALEYGVAEKVKWENLGMKNAKTKGPNNDD